MSETDVAAILKLSAEERMQLLERIWDSLAASPDEIPLSDAHRALLDERLSEHERSPDDVLSRSEILETARRGR